MLMQVQIERTEGILTSVAGSTPEGVWVPGRGIEFPCEYVLYGTKKYREIVRQTLRKVQKSRKRTKRKLNYVPTQTCQPSWIFRDNTGNTSRVPVSRILFENPGF